MIERLNKPARDLIKSRVSRKEENYSFASDETKFWRFLLIQRVNKRVIEHACELRMVEGE
jgi:hypothetical protein